MTVKLSPVAGAAWQFFDNSGVPLAGGKVFTYAAGTTTPATTYTSSSGLVTNTNPIILNAAGRADNEIWLTSDTTYKFVLKTSTDVLIGTYDDISGVNDVIVNTGSTQGLADVNNYLLPADTDYDDAFARALAECDNVYVPAVPRLAGANGVYAVTAPIAIGTGQSIQGDGSGVTIISSNSASTPVITINPNIYALSIRNLTVTHSVTATAGGDGIYMGQGSTNWVDQAYFEDVFARSNYVGFNLGKCYYATVNSCSALANVSHGFAFTSTGAASVSGIPQPGPLQWYLDGCVSQQNGGIGYSYLSTATGAALTYSISVGALNNCATFANGSYGVAVVGTDAGPVYSLRIEGGFYGNDYDHEVYIDGHSNGHVIRATMIELAGDPSGSSTACGIYITGTGPDANHQNTSTVIQVGHINGCKAEGIFTAAPDTSIIGGIITNNGLGLVASRRNGIQYFTGSSGIISGVRSYDRGAGTQQYGIAANIDELCISGCDLRNNLIAPTALPTIVNTIISGCRPPSINSAGAANTVTGNLTVTGSITAATGLTITAGDIDVTGDITASGTVQADTDLISNGDTHLNGPIALAGGVTVTAGNSVTVLNGGVTATNMRATSSLGVGALATGIAGQLSVSTGIDLNGTAYTNP